mgnify:CR=1 FL=1
MLLKNAKQRWIGLRKTAGDIADVFAPKNQVEALLIHAKGPNKGEVYKSFKGRNIITSFVTSTSPSPSISGRDLMRRLIAPPNTDSGTVAGSLSAFTSTGTDTGAYAAKMALGSGTSAENAADTALDAAIGGTEASISSVVFDPTYPYVTFITNWSEDEANTTIGEVSLLSGRGVRDFIGRKTFSSFTKTSDFTLQIRWTLRF